jgi:hypothetical protein
MSVQISHTRMIFKVLVVGRDLALQTGFLTQVSGRNVSTQLFNTLGVSLGIARYDGKDGFSVALQLWAIPYDERLIGLSQTFSKGYRAVIAITRPDEIQELPDLFRHLSITPDSNIVIGIIGSFDEVLESYRGLPFFFQNDLQLSSATDAFDIINNLAQKLVDNEKATAAFPRFFVLDESMCPIYQHPIQGSSEIKCSDEEIDEIQRILLKQGLRIIGDACIINIKEGIASISLRTGSVRLTPDICNFCIHHCKRDANVCIIAIDSGWSSQGISQKALLIAAKAIAIAERNLPQHVETQIQRISQCDKFILGSHLAANGYDSNSFAIHLKQAPAGKSLLEAAEERLKSGRLPRSAFNMLRKRLLTTEKSNND